MEYRCYSKLVPCFSGPILSLLGDCYSAFHSLFSVCMGWQPDCTPSRAGHILEKEKKQKGLDPKGLNHGQIPFISGLPPGNLRKVTSLLSDLVKFSPLKARKQGWIVLMWKWYETVKFLVQWFAPSGSQWVVCVAPMPSKDVVAPALLILWLDLWLRFICWI